MKPEAEDHFLTCNQVRSPVATKREAVAGPYPYWIETVFNRLRTLTLENA